MSCFSLGYLHVCVFVCLLLCEDPDWASCTLGIFVCLNCSGTHRNLPSVSRIKSIRLDFWDDELVQVCEQNIQMIRCLLLHVSLCMVTLLILRI